LYCSPVLRASERVSVRIEGKIGVGRDPVFQQGDRAGGKSGDGAGGRDDRGKTADIPRGVGACRVSFWWLLQFRLGSRADRAARGMTVRCHGQEGRAGGGGQTPSLATGWQPSQPAGGRASLRVEHLAHLPGQGSSGEGLLQEGNPLIEHPVVHDGVVRVAR
jgi:hypothetical protein